jgi:hypothetical protein|tara:strand:+ start:64 stop:1110 length:1047 start_codon:yes stop_codon:yes gene_type:complete
MKYNLIMENWRRFQTIEDDCLLFENKKITYDGLLIKLDNKEINGLRFLESLDHYITEKSVLYLNMLNEGMFKDGFKKLAMKTLNFVMSGVEKVKGFLSALDVSIGTGVYKIITKGLQILKKLSPVAKKIAKYVGPIAKVAVVVGMYLLMTSTAVAGVSIDPDLLSAAAELAADLQLGTSDQASEITTTMAQSIINVSDNGEQVMSIANDTFQVTGDANNAVDVSNKAIESLLMGARLNIDGDTLSPEQFAEILSKLDVEVQTQIEDAMRAAEEIKKTDPDLYEELKEAGDTLYLASDTDVSSEMTSQQIDQNTTGPDGTSTRDVSAFSQQGAQTSKSYATRGPSYSGK